jgi:hypothetical protein
MKVPLNNPVSSRRPPMTVSNYRGTILTGIKSKNCILSHKPIELKIMKEGD